MIGLKKYIYLFCIVITLLSCSNQKQVGEYPFIDVVSSVKNYKSIYCSDYFSSMELIPLETSDNCVVVGHSRHFGSVILLNNDFIFMEGENCLYAFNIKGEFINSVGKIGHGPAEYIYLNTYYFNKDESTIFVDAGDGQRILEYDYNGKYIRSIPIPIVESIQLSHCSYIGNSLFIGQISNFTGKIKNKFCIFDRNGNTVKCFPNHIFFDRNGDYFTTYDNALMPILVDDRIYIKDYYNDTIYILADYSLKPAFVFDFGKYTFSKEDMEGRTLRSSRYSDTFILKYLIGTSDYFFYSILVPNSFSKPKAKPFFSPMIKKNISMDHELFGIYNISANTNILLDTDAHLQKGIINDINGGMPFFPRYYAGDGVVVDYWTAEDMKEILTDEYFASQEIKDQIAHKKLREILINLKEDDNPVIVIAKIK